MAPLRASTRKRPSPDEVSAVAGTNGEMNPQVVCRTCWVVPVPGGQLGVWSTQQKTAGASGVVGVGMNGGLGRCASESVCSESGTFVIWRFCPPSFLGGGGSLSAPATGPGHHYLGSKVVCSLSHTFGLLPLSPVLEVASFFLDHSQQDKNTP